jgi:hypothetical protein
MSFIPPQTLRELPTARTGTAIIVPDRFDVSYEDLVELISITGVYSYFFFNYIS